MNKKGFTLVELLAVIAILAILVIIALPNVLSMFNSAKKDIFLTEAKNIYKEVSKKYISEAMKGNKITKISSDGTKLDMDSNDLTYNISLDDKGNIKNFQVSDGTYCLSGKYSNLSELTTDKITEGKCEEYDDISPEPIHCTFTGELVQGATYVNGQYTYRYKQKGGGKSSWININDEGWGVMLTDKTSTNPVTSKLCTYINNKPILYMSFMFSESNAEELDLSSFNTSNVTNMHSMFIKSKAAILDLSNFNTRNVIDMSYMFQNSNVANLDLSNFDTSKVTNMGSMFSYSKAEKINLNNLDTSNVTDMSGMFADCRVDILDLSNFNTSNVTDMRSMFSYAQATTLNLNSLDTSKVTNMAGMFANVKANSLDLSGFNTGNVTDMSSMFRNCKATVIDVSNFDTSNVTNMNAMFIDSQVEILDLSKFDTSKVKNMIGMFSSAHSLKTIYIGNKFNINSDTLNTNMFYNCVSLIGGQGTAFDSTKIDKTYARIDGGTSNPGYFTAK